MKTVIQIAAYFVFVGSTVSSANAQVTREQLASALASEKMTPLLAAIKEMDAESKRKSAVEVMLLIDEKLKSNPAPGTTSHGDALSLILALPHITDDSTLAAYLLPLADSGNEIVRSVTYDALTQGTGPAVGTILADKAGSSFAKLPMLPYVPHNTSEAREMSEQLIIFTSCLTGLLRSETQQARDAGAKYLEMTRRRYSGSESGQNLIEAIDKELKRSGISIPEVGKGGPHPALNEHAQQAPPNPKPEVPVTAKPLLQSATSIVSWLVLGGIVAIATILIVVFSRRR